jgi:allantoicase
VKNCYLTLSTFPKNQLARKLRLYGRPRRNFTGKELDSETGLYYYGNGFRINSKLNVIFTRRIGR